MEPIVTVKASRRQPQVILKQDRIFDFMCHYCEMSRGRPPTLREIAEALGISSTSVVTGYLKGLEERGLVERPVSATQGQSRSWWVRGGTWQRPTRPCFPDQQQPVADDKD